MEHLSFDIICRIADGELKQIEMELWLTHLNSCPSCQKEVELQKSILTVSRLTQLINPSVNFTQNVLEAVIPTKKKKWYLWILHNLGNTIAMAVVLSFLWYIFSITENSPLQNNKPTTIEPILNFFKIIQNGCNQFVQYLTPKSPLHGIETSQTTTIGFALLAIVLLAIIDQIANYYFRKSKV
jgi:hypothetical protein